MKKPLQLKEIVSAIHSHAKPYSVINWDFGCFGLTALRLHPKLDVAHAGYRNTGSLEDTITASMFVGFTQWLNEEQLEKPLYMTTMSDLKDHRTGFWCFVTGVHIQEEGAFVILETAHDYSKELPINHFENV